MRAGRPATKPSRQGTEPSGEVLSNATEIARVTDRPILAVIKNNGYGLGVVNAAQALEPNSAVHGFAVVKLQEARDLRARGIKKPILLMAPIDADDLRDAVSAEIMPMVYTPIGDLLAQEAAREIFGFARTEAQIAVAGIAARVALGVVAPGEQALRDDSQGFSGLEQAQHARRPGGVTGARHVAHAHTPVLRPTRQTHRRLARPLSGDLDGIVDREAKDAARRRHFDDRRCTRADQLRETALGDGQGLSGNRAPQSGRRGGCARAVGRGGGLGLALGPPRRIERRAAGVMFVERTKEVVQVVRFAAWGCELLRPIG